MGRAADLTRERIAREALVLLDTAGAAGLTMRSVAQRLGVQAPSLYHHVRGQDELVDAVHELVVAEIDRSGLDDDDWRRGLGAVARSYRDTFVRHREAVALVARRPVTGHGALAFYDQVLRALCRHGVPQDQVLTLVGSLDFLVLGAAVETFVDGFGQPAEAYAPEYPDLARALAGAGPHVDGAAFEHALTAWLDALAACIGTAGGGTGARSPRAGTRGPRDRG